MRIALNRRLLGRVQDTTRDGSSLVLFGPSDYEMLDQLLLKFVGDHTQELGDKLDEWLNPWATQQY